MPRNGERCARFIAGWNHTRLTRTCILTTSVPPDNNSITTHILLFPILKARGLCERASPALHSVALPLCALTSSPAAFSLHVATCSLLSLAAFAGLQPETNELRVSVWLHMSKFSLTWKASKHRTILGWPWSARSASASRSTSCRCSSFKASQSVSIREIWSTRE